MRNKYKATNLFRELKKTEDGINGTLNWIKPKVQPDVYEKIRTIAKQSIRYGIMLNSLEGQAFAAGIDKELGND